MVCEKNKVWLRRTQQKVGRLSAGSKITSLLTANDIVFCGTEAGVIKVNIHTNYKVLKAILLFGWLYYH